MMEFLQSTDVIDWRHPQVTARAAALRENESDPSVIAKRCFEWVRDEIRHSRDYGLTPVTCSASEVLQERSGYCYAKSHLLAALLRANGIPAGFCYQRLSRDGNGPPFSLHGFNAIFLPDIAWYRVDPRGNKPGVNARFAPPIEQLAFNITVDGEMDLSDIYPDPLIGVVKALRSHHNAQSLWEGLPDV